jgi:hypothetical protein
MVAGIIPVSSDFWNNSAKIPGMVKRRPGFHYLCTQIPLVEWGALRTEAERTEVSVAILLTEILRKHYRIPVSAIPKKKRAGRPPKRKDDQ